MTNTKSAIKTSNMRQPTLRDRGEQLQLGNDLIEYAKQYARKTRSCGSVVFWNRIHPGMEVKALVNHCIKPCPLETHIIVLAKSN